MLGASLNKAFYHPQPNLQPAWNCTQFGLLTFPLSPGVGAVSICLGVLLTWLQAYRTIIRRPLSWGLALLGGLLIITAGLAEQKIDAFLGLFNLVPFFIIFSGLSTVIQTPTQLRYMAWILVTSSQPIVMMGFGQLFWGWALNLKFLWIVLDWTLDPGGLPPGRMASILLHANTLAAYLIVIFTLALGLWLEELRKFREVGENRSISPLIQNLKFPFLTLVIITNFIALILTDSRNGWTIAIVTCLAFALYQGWRLLVGGVLGMATSILLAAFAPGAIAKFFRQFVPAFFWARLNDNLYPDRPVALMRKTQWEFAWSLSKEHPWTGWGLRSFSRLYKAHSQISLGHPHNLFLMLSAETGFPCTFLFCGLVGWIFFSGVQLLRQSKSLDPGDRLIFFTYLVVFIGLVLFNTVDVTLFEFRLNTFWWWVLAAIAGMVFRGR
jgi:O-antigen ligase